MNIQCWEKPRGTSNKDGIRYGNDDPKTVRTRSRNRRRNKVARRSRKVNFGLTSGTKSQRLHLH